MIQHLTAVFLAVLACIHVMAPRTGMSRELAYDAAVAVSEHVPPNGWSYEESVATMAVLAWHESRLNTRAVGSATCNKTGDCGAYGAWQVEHHPEMLGDGLTQARFAYSVIRKGASQCPAHPLAPFVGSCTARGARAIADDRMMEARSALRASEIH